MKLLIRVDAYPELGTGHLMRCFALAEGARDAGLEIVFLSYCTSPSLLQRIRGEGFELIELQAPGVLEETLRVIGEQAPSWVVLDGYHFGCDYQRAVKEMGLKLLVIDDYAHLEHYHADMILNQNFGAEKLSYSAEPYTRLLLGTKYVLLRREFLKYMDFQRGIPSVAKKLLITLGGSDPENNTLKVLRALNHIKDRIEIKVVIGSDNPFYETIKEEAERGLHNMEVLQSVEDMAPLMAWADVAFTAGGSTLWELALLGVPTIACIIAENQRPAVESLSAEGTIISVGDMDEASTSSIANQVSGLLADKSLREKLSARCSKIVDGAGAGRVIEAMLKTNGYK